ncbi:MAG: hypothetical protein WCA44_15370 [Acidobacteriaceae bacterium]|jgi:hypothetical protein
MPVETKEEDKPARVRFHRNGQEGAVEITCSMLEGQDGAPYRVEGGASCFGSLTALRARVVEVGMSPAVAEDPSRSFNATARQLRELGFQVSVRPEA